MLCLWLPTDIQQISKVCHTFYYAENNEHCPWFCVLLQESNLNSLHCTVSCHVMDHILCNLTSAAFLLSLWIVKSCPSVPKCASGSGWLPLSFVQWINNDALLSWLLLRAMQCVSWNWNYFLIALLEVTNNKLAVKQKQKLLKNTSLLRQPSVVLTNSFVCVNMSRTNERLDLQHNSFIIYSQFKSSEHNLFQSRLNTKRELQCWYTQTLGLNIPPKPDSHCMTYY